MRERNAMMAIRRAATGAPDPAAPKSAETLLWIPASSAILVPITENIYSPIPNAAGYCATQIVLSPTAATARKICHASPETTTNNATMEIRRAETDAVQVVLRNPAAAEIQVSAPEFSNAIHRAAHVKLQAAP